MNEDKMPLFLINGFLEAGKTQFIKFTMQQDYFQTEGKTLLIVCEEGEEEYDEELLKQTHTAVVYIEEAEKLTPEYLQDLELLQSGASSDGVERYVESGCPETSERLGSVSADHDHRWFHI